MIGILLTGHMRTAHKTYESFHECFKTINKKIFCHSWSTIGHTDPVWWSNVGDGNIQKIESDKIKEYYYPENYLIEEQEKFITDNELYKRYGGYQAIHGQFKSVKRAFNLLKQYEIDNNIRFTYIIKARYDIEYLNQFSYTGITTDNIYVIPTFHSKACNLYTDIMFMSDRDTFEKIIEFDTEMDKYLHLAIEKHHIIEGEAPFTEFLKSNNFFGKNIDNLYLNCNIKRLNGETINLYK